MAPTYVASLVTLIVGGQALFGLDFAPEQWTAFITVLMALIVMVRQWRTGRSNLFGFRP